ncbi:hypothetical protein SNE40_011363 [Patella caerulea]|uniref:Uncharacterized protein n=1 Tax=Patella caerulea TaxID=87958 RepID=A0AAN8JJR5_PATCE
MEALYVAPQTACWQCKTQETSLCFIRARHLSHSHGAEFTDTNLLLWIRLMMGLVDFLKVQLGPTSLPELLLFVERHQLHSSASQSADPFSLEERLVLQRAAMVMGLTDLLVFIVTPPRCILELFHWRVLCSLLALLPDGMVRIFKSLQVNFSVSLKESVRVCLRRFTHSFGSSPGFHIASNYIASPHRGGLLCFFLNFGVENQNRLVVPKSL